MNKKGQTATEYMIILAVVIIIALIVVGVLGGIPGIGGSAGSRALSSYWATSEIGVVSAAADDDDDVLLRLKNNNQFTIEITNVRLSPTGQASVVAFNDTNTILGIGAEKSFTGNIDGICGNVGDAWVSNIEVTYVNQQTGTTHVFEGDGRTLQGYCADEVGD